MTDDEHWTRTLDLFEAGLAVHALTLSDGEATTPNPWPPSGLPTEPIPPHLRARAFALLDQSASLADNVRAQLEEMDQPRRPRRHARLTVDHARFSTTL